MLSQKLITPVFMWLLVLMGAVVCYFFLPSGQLYSPGIAGWVNAVLCFAYWLPIVWKALPQHRQAIRSVSGIDHLLTDGVYALCRPPLYGAHIVFLWGIVLLIATPRALAIAVWCTIVLVLWARLEEWGLDQKFGQVYRDYRKTTPMMIPRMQKKV